MKEINTMRYASWAAIMLLCAGPFAHAQEWQRPDSPFTLGEAQPEVSATCETAKYWIDHAPQIDGRVSFTIEGEIVAIEWDGALAYLVMCKEPGVQVMCVTYSKEGRESGETAIFAGGYARAGERRIMLDPCLASEE
jgi:hypothetical protein